MDERDIRFLEETHPDMYFTNGEAAAVVGVCPSTMRAWARTGRLDDVKSFRSKYGWRYFRAGDVFTLRDGRTASGRPLDHEPE
ncbi:helix-turn-helix domain-containing protein [Nocardiopsis sp. YSL2]|uniref:helix-turn-helix domain-containing protein n=1 Tax=Nocardiopsis sp. YSL2 TaxID=2939492 RepID=UPI0026F41853|nr:helix-turn-helix domain-containing protein [Nocardiopsis sp. YSL2]